MHVVFWMEGPDAMGASTDHFVIYETQALADEHCDKLAQTPGVYCWGTSPIRRSSDWN